MVCLVQQEILRQLVHHKVIQEEMEQELEDLQVHQAAEEVEPEDLDHHHQQIVQEEPEDLVQQIVFQIHQ